MSTPDFVICFDCESPVYTFEWDGEGAKVKEAVCPTCGNDQPNMFSTEEELEEMSSGDSRNYGPSGE